MQSISIYMNPSSFFYEPGILTSPLPSLSIVLKKIIQEQTFFLRNIIVLETFSMYIALVRNLANYDLPQKKNIQ